MINIFRLNIMLKSKHSLYSISFWVEGKINEKYYNFNFNHYPSLQYSLKSFFLLVMSLRYLLTIEPEIKNSIVMTAQNNKPSRHLRSPAVLLDTMP